MDQVLVRLVRRHPRGKMRGRLADGVTVVEVTREGVVLERGQISREMERTGWFEVEELPATVETTEGTGGTEEKPEAERGDAGGAETQGKAEAPKTKPRPRKEGK